MVRALCAVYVGRLLGLYMVLPVLSPHTERLHGSTPMLVGLSLGIYGATQALFQIPFGAISDSIGRRPAITIGLVLFAGGSLLAAFAADARFLVVARALQGSGAISSVVLALISDLTREEVRTRAMAQVGIWIGVTFAIAFIAGPPLAALFGVPFLFLLTAVGALFSLVLLLVAVDDSSPSQAEERLHTADLFTILRQPPLLLVDIGVFLLHVTVTVLFVVLPFDLARVMGEKRIWVVLVPAILIGIAVMAASGRLADRGRWKERLFFLGATLLALCCLFFGLVERNRFALLVGLILFVVAIAILEPILASLLSLFTGGRHRGTATGVYSMAQYSGAFIGGILGGAFLHHGQKVLFLTLFVLALLWGVGLTRIGRLRPRRLPSDPLPKG